MILKLKEFQTRNPLGSPKAWDNGEERYEDSKKVCQSMEK